jgi:hypothetical protein
LQKSRPPLGESDAPSNPSWSETWSAVRDVVPFGSSRIIRFESPAFSGGSFEDPVRIYRTAPTMEFVVLRRWISVRPFWSV